MVLAALDYRDVDTEKHRRRQAGFPLLRIVLVVFVGFFASSCGKGPGAKVRPGDDSGPWIEFAETTWDFGPMFANQNSVHEFVFRNRGRTRLEIRDVKAECGCSKPVFSTLGLNPGEEGRMTVHFTPPAPVPLKKLIRVYTNDTYLPEVVITLLATGLGSARIEPSEWKIDGDVPLSGKSRTFELRVRPEETIEEIRLLTAETTPWLGLGEVRLSGTHVGHFDLLVEPPPEVTGVRETLTLQIGVRAGGKRHDFAAYLPITGRIRPLAAAEPPVLHMTASGTRNMRSSFRITVPAEWPADPGIRWVGLPEGASVQRRSESEFEVLIPAGGFRRFLGEIKFDYGEGRCLALKVHGAVGSST